MNDSKAITLSIGSIEDMGARFTDAWHRAEKGEDVGEAHLTFPDLPEIEPRQVAENWRVAVLRSVYWRADARSLDPGGQIMDDAQKTKWIIALLVTIAFAVLVVMVYKVPPPRPAPGLGVRVLAGLVAIPTGFIGLVIGDVLRRAVMPDAIMTSGGFFGLLKAKLFWAIGPQAVGLAIGVFGGAALVF